MNIHNTQATGIDVDREKFIEACIASGYGSWIEFMDSNYPEWDVVDVGYKRNGLLCLDPNSFALGILDTIHDIAEIVVDWPDYTNYSSMSVHAFNIPKNVAEEQVNASAYTSLTGFDPMYLDLDVHEAWSEQQYPKWDDESWLFVQGFMRSARSARNT